MRTPPERITETLSLTQARCKRALRDPAAFAFKVACRFELHALAAVLTRDPRTFNEKVRYKMVRDRRPILGVFADKLAAKQYVADRVGREFTAATVAVADTALDVPEDRLPREYAAKVTHASGGVILVTDSARHDACLPKAADGFSRHTVHPDVVPYQAIGSLLDRWLELRYGVDVGEWAYGLVPPRIVIEEYLRSPGGGPPPDLKFFVFHGRCHLIRMDQPMAETKTLNHFDREGHPISARFREYQGDFFPTLDPAPRLPDHWREMMRIAERLGRDTDFVRVDMYVLRDRLVVGELTNYPTNGTGSWEPSWIDAWLGDQWQVPDDYG